MTTLTPTLMFGAITIGDVLGMRGDLRLLGGVESGRADHGGNAELAAEREVGERAFGPREVDQHLARGERGADVAADPHAARLAEEGRGVAAEAGAAGTSSAAARTRSVLRDSASISARPIRPDAPAMATRRRAPTAGAPVMRSARAAGRCGSAPAAPVRPRQGAPAPAGP